MADANNWQVCRHQWNILNLSQSPKPSEASIRSVLQRTFKDQFFKRDQGVFDDPFHCSERAQSTCGQNSLLPDWFLSPVITALSLERGLQKDMENEVLRRAITYFFLDGEDFEDMCLRPIDIVYMIDEQNRSELSVQVETLAHVLLVISWKLEVPLVLRFMAREWSDPCKPLKETITDLRNMIQKLSDLLIVCAFLPEEEIVNRLFVINMEHLLKVVSIFADMRTDQFPWWGCFFLNFRRVIQTAWISRSDLEEAHYSPFQYPEDCNQGLILNPNPLCEMRENQVCDMCHSIFEGEWPLFSSNYGLSDNFGRFPRECFSQRSSLSNGKPEDTHVIDIVCSPECLVQRLRMPSSEMNEVLIKFVEISRKLTLPVTAAEELMWNECQDHRKRIENHFSLTNSDQQLRFFNRVFLNLEHGFIQQMPNDTRPDFLHHRLEFSSPAVLMDQVSAKFMASDTLNRKCWTRMPKPRLPHGEGPDRTGFTTELRWESKSQGASFPFDATDKLIKVNFLPHNTVGWCLLNKVGALPYTTEMGWEKKNFQFYCNLSSRLKSILGGPFFIFPVPAFAEHSHHFQGGIWLLVRPKTQADQFELNEIFGDVDALIYASDFDIIQRTAHGGVMFKDGDSIVAYTFQAHKMFQYLLGNSTFKEMCEEQGDKFQCKETVPGFEKKLVCSYEADKALAFGRKSLMEKYVLSPPEIKTENLEFMTTNSSGEQCQLLLRMGILVNSPCFDPVREEVREMLGLDRKSRCNAPALLPIFSPCEQSDRSWTDCRLLGNDTCLKFDGFMAMVRLTLFVYWEEKSMSKVESLLVQKSHSIAFVVGAMRERYQIPNEVTIIALKVTELKRAMLVQDQAITFFGLADITGEDMTPTTMALMIKHGKSRATQELFFDRSLVDDVSSFDGNDYFSLGTARPLLFSKQSQKIVGLDDCELQVRFLLRQAEQDLDVTCTQLQSHFGTWPDCFTVPQEKARDFWKGKQPFLTLLVVVSPVWSRKGGQRGLQSWTDRMRAFLVYLGSKPTGIPLAYEMLDEIKTHLALRYTSVTRSFFVDFYPATQKIVASPSSRGINPLRYIFSRKFVLSGIPAFVSFLQVEKSGLGDIEQILSHLDDDTISFMVPITHREDEFQNLLTFSTHHLKLEVLLAQGIPFPHIQHGSGNLLWNCYLVYLGPADSQLDSKRLFMASRWESLSFKLHIVPSETHCKVLEFYQSLNLELYTDPLIEHTFITSEDKVIWEGQLAVEHFGLSIPIVLSTESELCRQICDALGTVFKGVKVLDFHQGEEVRSLASESLATTNVSLLTECSPQFSPVDIWITWLKQGALFVCLRPVYCFLKLIPETQNLVIQIPIDDLNPVESSDAPSRSTPPLFRKTLSSITVLEKNHRLSQYFVVTQSSRLCPNWLVDPDLKRRLVPRISHFAAQGDSSVAGLEELVDTSVQEGTQVELHLIQKGIESDKPRVDVTRNTTQVLMAVPNRIDFVSGIQNSIATGEMDQELCGMILRYLPDRHCLAGYLIRPKSFFKIMKIIQDKHWIHRLAFKGGSGLETNTNVLCHMLIEDCAKKGPELGDQSCLTKAQVANIATGYPFEAALNKLGGCQALTRLVKVKRHQWASPEDLGLRFLMPGNNNQQAAQDLLKRVVDRSIQKLTGTTLKLSTCSVCQSEDFDLQVCSRCKSETVKYCSNECFQKDVLSHRKICKDRTREMLAPILARVKKTFPKRFG